MHPDIDLNNSANIVENDKAAVRFRAVIDAPSVALAAAARAAVCALALSVFCASSAMAATLLGEPGATCVTLLPDAQAQGAHTIALTQNVALGQTLLISAVQDSGVVSISAASDSAGNTYFFNTQQQSPNLSLASVYARIDHALAAGATLTLTWSAVGVSAQSCVEIAAFGGVSAVSDPRLQSGGNSGSSKTQSVSANKGALEDGELVYGAFAYRSAVGPTFAAPAQALAGVCNGAGSLCLYPAWGATATGSAGDTVNITASAHIFPEWVGVLDGFSTSVIFANGFE